MSKVILVNDVQKLHKILESKKYEDENIVVWDGEGELHEILKDDRLFDSICKNLKFSKGVTLIKKFDDGIKIYPNLKSLLDLLNISPSLTSEDTIIVESDSREELIELLQQMIYLRYTPEVSTRSEHCKKSWVDCLMNNKKTLHEKIELVEKRVGKELKNPEFRKLENDGNYIFNIVKNIKDHIKNLKKKEINITVFGTKKSGKSMVINLLLGEEIAPTSLELPTPTVIIYKPHDGNEIIIKMEGFEKKFQTVEEAREFLRSNFEKISDTKEPSMEPITILYPIDMGNFVIYDTPGPDLAGQEKHKEFVKEYIPKSDIAIFVMDYTKYATESEIQLLEELHNYFKEKGKDFSLIVLLNKIDTALIDVNIDKGIVRLTNFIYTKVKSLGFKDIIVIPISAMYSFYLLTVEKYKEALPPEDDIIRSLDKLVRELKSKLRTKRLDERTRYSIGRDAFQIGEIADLVRKIERITDLIVTDLSIIRRFLGMDYFEKYLRLVMERKAWYEKMYQNIFGIETGAKEIHNLVENRKILIQEKIEGISKIIEEFDDCIKNNGEKAKNELLEMLKNDFKKNLFESFDKALDDAHNITIVTLEEEFDRTREELFRFINLYKVRTINKTELESYFNGIMNNLNSRIISILHNYPQKLRELIPSGRGIGSIKVPLKDRYKKIADNFKEGITKCLNELNRSLKSRYNIDDLNYEIPDVELSIDWGIMEEKIDNLITEGMESLRINIDNIDKYTRRSFIGKIWDFIRGERKFDIEGFKNEFNKKQKELIKRIEEDFLKNFEKKLLSTFKIELWEKIEEAEKSKIDEFLKSIGNPVEQLRDWIFSKERETIAEFLTIIANRLKPFYYVYNHIYSTCLSEDCKKNKGVRNV